MANIKDVAKLLFDEDGNIRTSIVVFTAGSFWLFASWTLGALPMFGSGFARAETMDRVEINQIENSILDRCIR